MHAQCIYSVRQWIGRFCNTVFSGSATLELLPLSPFCCQLWSVLLSMEPWTGAKVLLLWKRFTETVTVLWPLTWTSKKFGVHRNRAVPLAHAIKTWVRNFEATGCTLKKKGGSVKTVGTPENIAVVSEAIERSPYSSLGVSEISSLQSCSTARSSGVETSNSARSHKNSCGDASKSDGWGS